MKKRCCLVLILCCFVFILGGCGAQIPDMTAEERKAISEYAAGLLLKYDTSQPSRLVDLDALEEDEQITEPKATQVPGEDVTVTPTPVPETPEEQPGTGDEAGENETPESWDSLESVLLLPDELTVHYKNYECVKTYTDEDQGTQELDAGAGKQLLVFSFEMLNSSSENQKIDMLQDNIRYKVYVGETLCNGMITMFNNDLPTYIGEIDAGESIELKLFAEVKEELLQAQNGILIEFVCGEKKAKIIAK